MENFYSVVANLSHRPFTTVSNRKLQKSSQLEAKVNLCDNNDEKNGKENNLQFKLSKS